MLRRLGILAVLTVAASATLTAPAHAAGHVICVGSPAGTCDEHKATLQLALGAAAGNGQANTILLGPGTYGDGPFSLDGTAHPLTVRGSGQGVTILTAPVSTAHDTYVKAKNATVQNLTIALQAASSVQDRGLDLTMSTADRVTITGAGTGNAFGIMSRDSSTVSHSVVQFPLGTQDTGVNANGGTTVTDTTVTADFGFTHSAENTTDTLSRVSIRANRHGIYTDSGDVQIDDAVIDLGTAADAIGIRVENTNNATSSKAVSANHVTIVGGGAGSYGVYAYAASAAGLQHATVLLGNSIVRGPATDLYAVAGNDGAQGGNSDATIGVLYSDWHSKAAVSQPHGTASIAVGAGHLDVVPVFRDAAHGNYRLAPGSPLIDRGMPGTSALTLDLDRHARVQDGNRDGASIRDMGAYEAAPDTVAPSTRITSHPKKRTSKRRVTFRFAANEASVTFECKLDAKPWASCSSAKAYRVKPGWHRFKVRAVDAAHNVDPTPARFRFHRA